MERLMKTKCLMVELADGRKFFTKINSQSNLIEFSKTFDANLKIVIANDPELLSLKKLAKSICNNENGGSNVEFTVLKMLSNKNKSSHGFITEFTKFSNLTTKQKYSSKSKSVFDYIIEKLKSGDKINIKDFAEKMKKHDISISTIYRFLNLSKKMLKEKDGLNVSKISPGIYAVTKAD